MSIRFAILGLLVEEPLHGYAIQATLEERFGELCDPGPGEVYRVLAALSRDGLVTAATARVGRRPRRKVYAPTAAGRRALDAWLQGTSPAPPRARRDERWLRSLVAARVAPALLVALADADARRGRIELAEISAAAPAPRRGATFADVVLAVRHASAVLDARAALHAAELWRATVARHAAGTPVATLLRDLAHVEPPVAAERASSRRAPPGGRGPTG